MLYHFTVHGMGSFRFTSVAKPFNGRIEMHRVGGNPIVLHVSEEDHGLVPVLAVVLEKRGVGPVLPCHTAIYH